MVLMCEQERLIADELALVNDATFYSIGVVTDWTTIATKNITLAKQLIVMIKTNFHSALDGSGSANYWNGRIKVDGIPLWTLGGTCSNTIPGNDYSTPDIYILLGAGAHTITFDAAMWVAGGTSRAVGVNFIFIAQLNFNDVLGGAYESVNTSVPAGVQTVVLDPHLAISAARSTPIGPIANYALFVFVVVEDVAASPVRQTHMKNIGESNDDSKINITLFIRHYNNSTDPHTPQESVQVNFTARTNDDTDGNATNPSYGRGAKGTYVYYTPTNSDIDVIVQA